MSSDELEDKLNSIDDRVHIKIRRMKPDGYNALTINANLNRYSEKITVLVTNTDAKNDVLLFTLFKKRYGLNHRWELDTRSNNPTWTVEYMDFYLKALKIAQEFMEDNNGN